MRHLPLGSSFGSKKLPQYVAAIIVNLMSIAYGVVAGWSSPSLPLLKLGDPAVVGPITDDEETWLGSVTQLAAFVASPVYSYINQNWGRKAAGYLSATPCFIGWILIIFSSSFIHLLIGRILMGASLAGVNVFVVMYVGEISENNIRGALGTLRGVGADLGIVFTYSVGPYLSVRDMGIVCITIPLLFLVIFFWIPESPMFLLGKGKAKEATEAYIWLRGGDTSAAEEEMKNLKVVVEMNPEEVTLKQLLSVRGTRNALLIAVVFALVIQFSGMYVICSYAARLFELSGSNISPTISAIIISVITVLGSLLSLILADLSGRRGVLIWTQALEGVSLGALGIYLYVKLLGYDVSSVGVLPVVSLSLYCISIAAGVATLGYVVISETFRAEARGLAMTVTSCIVWGSAFITTKFHHSLEGVIGLHGCFWVYAGVSFAGALFTFVRVPETKNRSLESILRELNGDPPLEEISNP